MENFNNKIISEILTNLIKKIEKEKCVFLIILEFRIDDFFASPFVYEKEDISKMNVERKKKTTTKEN